MNKRIATTATFFAVALFLIVPAALAADTIVVQHELGETVVPKNPERVVVFDFGVLDMLDTLDIDIVGLPRDLVPSYLSHYDSSQYENLGSLKEPDFERIYLLKPDLIIISGRQSDLYDEFVGIAPTIYIDLDTTRYMESFKENAQIIGEIFEKEDEVAQQLASIDESIVAVQERTAKLNANALIVLVNDRALSAYGAGSRFGLIHDVLNFTPVDASIVASTHGQNISYEFILANDPDYLFVVDRTAAIGGESAAKQVVENRIVQLTKAYADDHIVYLNPDNWYLSVGGFVSLQAMIDEVAAALD